jgi:hypothetical protein
MGNKVATFTEQQLEDYQVISFSQKTPTLSKQQ